jgi:hypothetical protein
MDLDLTPEEARDEQIAELTKKNFDARWALLGLKDPRTVADVCTSVLDYLAHSGDLPELVMAAASASTRATGRFDIVVRSVVWVEAEADARREIEQQELMHRGD